MRDYELLFIAVPTLEQDPLNALLQRVGDLITTAGGTVEKGVVMGRRRLAYPIDRHAEGVYVLFWFQGDNAVLSTLNRQLRLNEEVVRHTVVYRDARTKTADAARAAKAAVAAAEAAAAAAAAAEAGAAAAATAAAQAAAQEAAAVPAEEPMAGFETEPVVESDLGAEAAGPAEPEVAVAVESAGAEAEPGAGEEAAEGESESAGQALE